MFEKIWGMRLWIGTSTFNQQSYNVKSHLGTTEVLCVIRNFCFIRTGYVLTSCQSIAAVVYTIECNFGILQAIWEFCWIQVVCFILLTLTRTPLNLTKHYRTVGICKNWSKSDNVIDAGPIYVRNRWPHSVTGLAWHGWSRDWCERGPGINSGENHHFWWCQFQMKGKIAKKC